MLFDRRHQLRFHPVIPPSDSLRDHGTVIIILGIMADAGAVEYVVEVEKRPEFHGDLRDLKPFLHTRIRNETIFHFILAAPDLVNIPYTGILLAAFSSHADVAVREPYEIWPENRRIPLEFILA